MLPSFGGSSRLKDSRIIKALLSQKPIHYGKFMIVFANHNDLVHSRLAVVCVKRLKGAANRNRLKRRLRHAARKLLTQKGYDFVLIGKSEGLNAPFEDILAEIDTVLIKLAKNGKKLVP
jgi:ribonuclease P protein component